MIPSIATIHLLAEITGNLGLLLIAEYVELISPIVKTPPSVRPFEKDLDSAKVVNCGRDEFEAKICSSTVAPSNSVPARV